MRLQLALALVLLFVAASPSAAERRRPLISEVADARECEIVQDSLVRCITVQVVRSRFPDGGEETILFVSARENDGENDVETSGFPPFSFPIDSQHFVMDRDGTRAILNFQLPLPDPPAEGQSAETQPAIMVTWDANDDFSSRRFSINVVKEKTEEGLTKTRLIEREQERSANAEGRIEPSPNGGSAPQVAINISSAALNITKTIQRTRLLEEEPDFPEVPE